VALDSILSTPAPQPPKAAARSQSPSSGSSGTANSLGSPASSVASANSTAGSAAGSNGSGGGSDGSASSASRTAAKNAGKSGSGSSNRGASSTRGSTASTQSKNASASSQPKQNTASSTQTQSTAGSGAGAQTAAGASSNSDGPSFIEALAQSQAQAADSVSTVATVTPEEVTGSAKSSKAEKSAAADDSPSSLGFLSQSLAAVMAGVQQQPTAGQATAANSSADGASVDGVSLASGSSIQNIVASLTKGTAAELKAVTAAADGDPKGGAAATATGAADGSASGPSAFQAQMSVGSHFQTTANTQMANDKVSAPVGTPAFNDELGGKITWMANQGVQSASLQLSPEHLGPVAVHISVQDGSASVAFNANHADTRAALEKALPQLREMFATQGLTLTDASVSQQSPRGQPQKQAVAAIGAIGGVSSEESTSPLAAVASTRLGLVDTYA
jgi:flagellar hook-length control protein FliK